MSTWIREKYAGQYRFIDCDSGNTHEGLDAQCLFKESIPDNLKESDSPERRAILKTIKTK